ncbi:hypothetical protein ACFY05_32030 [Microtetraspora fusca]|uniref:Uncharacterized protein n=1 Tax=Microtetraspora fusca TaxID=1997 RepID=A0ABW6VEF1_MICFU
MLTIDATPTPYQIPATVPLNTLIADQCGCRAGRLLAAYLDVLAAQGCQVQVLTPSESSAMKEHAPKGTFVAVGDPKEDLKDLLADVFPERRAHEPSAPLVVLWEDAHVYPNKLLLALVARQAAASKVSLIVSMANMLDTNVIDNETRDFFRGRILFEPWNLDRSRLCGVVPRFWNMPEEEIPHPASLWSGDDQAALMVQPYNDTPRMVTFPQIG